MKTIAFTILLFAAGLPSVLAQAQGTQTASPVIEGGRLVVELIKAIAGKKELDKNPGCKNSFADLCILNQSGSTINVSALCRMSGEVREVVVLPGGKECFLQVNKGVWTYDLKISGDAVSLRKGDVLIEGCNNMEMTVR